MAGGGLPTSVAENQGVTGAPATSPSGTVFANTPLATNFSESEYLTNNPDVADAVRRGYVTSGLQHYLQHGQSEGRTPSHGAAAGEALDYLNRPFNDQQYLALNPDVAQAIADRRFTGTGREHYLMAGQSEGRAPSAVANRGSSITAPSYYNTNPVGVNYEAIFNPATRPVFDEESYLTQKAQQLQRTGYQGPYTGTTNADLRNYINNVAGMSLQEHYNRYGRDEGLNPYASGRTERVPVVFTQPTLTPQQQANYLSEWQQDYNQRMQASMADARQQRVARAQAVQADYNTKKAQAEAQAAASNQEAINRAVQEALAQQQASEGYGWTSAYSAAKGGIASLAKGFKK